MATVKMSTATIDWMNGDGEVSQDVVENLWHMANSYDDLAVAARVRFNVAVTEMGDHRPSEAMLIWIKGRMQTAEQRAKTLRAMFNIANDQMRDKVRDAGQ